MIVLATLALVAWLGTRGLRTPARVSNATAGAGRLPVAAKPSSPPAVPKPADLSALRDRELGDVRVAARCAARAADIADRGWACTTDSMSSSWRVDLFVSRDAGDRLVKTAATLQLEGD